MCVTINNRWKNIFLLGKSCKQLPTAAAFYEKRSPFSRKQFLLLLSLFFFGNLEVTRMTQDSLNKIMKFSLLAIISQTSLNRRQTNFWFMAKMCSDQLFLNSSRSGFKRNLVENKKNIMTSPQTDIKNSHQRWNLPSRKRP